MRKPLKSKTTATTQVLVLNGEETILGGLFVNEESVARNGIPFLRDLPWWVFGIRYLTGSDETITRKKELVILIKTELVPTLQERLDNPVKNPLNSEISNQKAELNIISWNLPAQHIQRIKNKVNGINSNC